MEYATYVVDDSTIREPGVRLKNNSPDPVRVEAAYGVGPRDNPKFNPRLPKNKDNPAMLPATVMIRTPDGGLALAPRPPTGAPPLLVVPPGAEIVVPDGLARALVREACGDCGPHTPAGLTCRDATHARVVVGGLAPRLVRLAADGSVTPTKLAPELEPAPAPVLADADLHSRVMRRIGGAK